MDKALKKVDVYIGTSIKGPNKGIGRCAYVMKSTKKNGEPYESDPEIAQYEDATESRLVIYAIRDALNRLNYACEVVIHTECNYAAAVFNLHWLEEWQRNGWKNKRNKDVADSRLWNEIQQEIEESGHLLQAITGKHEFSDWMRWKLVVAQEKNNEFFKVEKN